ncbi:serine/threonine protein kinase [Lyngbya confervoides]|uniref:Serine/threonine protein kinase n=1 Tax=Lyngbya confervoides BDU141951 TaxID=1574623 RepID=A0ABD4T6A4_9CYAN|nr:serine/threonine-protein kinase [Lyngbya confervoides]MCM1983770.1 serine/threonine protein kinase [Lyngbya confervoides BDU141951]
MLTTDAILTDRYQIKELLSQKAGRQTFLAKDLHSQVPVIIKLLRFGDGFEWDDLKLFEREAATLKNLDHPEIPKYIDYFEIDEVDTPGFALVQSYIEAPSLATLIARGRKFSETEIIELADRLLGLLIYLHQQAPPVIHRDIKPSNILLANRSGNSMGDVYLVDFGSVQTVAKQEEGTVTIVGSYGYIPLEQFGGQTTTASDLYSLGMTLIYLLTGTHPAELPQVDGRVKFNAEISKRLQRWLEKMTHPHLDKRFDSAKVAQLALKSEDGSYGNFDQLKPAHTQIRLYRDQNRLQITWYHENPNFFLQILAGWLLFASIISLVFSSLTYMFFVFFICLMCFFLVNGLTRMIPKNNRRHKTSCHLIIDEGHIYNLKDRKQGHNPIKLSEHPRSLIEILAYNPGYTFDKCLDTNGKLIQGSAITIPPKLYLYCGNFEYSFPAHFSSAKFSQTELWWLGQELSDFLNLELQVIYPTPEVPPASSCGGGC